MVTAEGVRDFAPGLKRLRRVQAVWLAIGPGGLAAWCALAVLGAIGVLPWVPAHDELLVRVFWAWAIAGAIASAVLRSWRCPRCGERFFQPSRRAGNPFASSCAHCGLNRRAARSV